MGACTKEVLIMAKVYVSNAFSLNMLNTSDDVSIKVKPMSPAEAAVFLHSNTWESAWGHPSSAPLYSMYIDAEIPINRVSLTLEKGDVLVVGQYKGPRLEEGATVLPEGAHFETLKVEIL